jgi:hypothetical protein
LAVALLFVEKIRQQDAQFWFGLRIVGFLHSQAVISRTIVDFPAFLEHGSAEPRDPNKEDDNRHFCMKWLRTLKFFQKFKIKVKKSKTYSG